LVERGEEILREINPKRRFFFVHPALKKKRSVIKCSRDPIGREKSRRRLSLFFLLCPPLLVLQEKEQEAVEKKGGVEEYSCRTSQ
jgi:hypothetical protein